MNTIIEYIEYLRGRPHHIRKRIALGVASGVSALIAFAWLASSLAVGTFAIQGSDFAMSTGQGMAVATTSESGNQNLAGVDAASALKSADAPIHIEVVDTTPAPVKKPEETTLPF